MKALPLLRNGFAYRMGDGSSSSWFFPSTSIGKLSEHVLYVDIHNLHLTISDVVQDGKWKVDQLYTQLPSFVTDIIVATPVCLSDQIPNGFTWKENQDGT